jgi:putative flippase GtrA
MPSSNAESQRRNAVTSFVTARTGDLSRTAIAFGLVGLGGMVIDLTVFNVLRLGLLGPAFSLAYKPLTASVISASIAIVFNWLGSRYWAFRDSRRGDALREFVEYALVALLGLGIGLATLAFTHYTLGMHSLVADNISKNVIGLALGTVTRFLLLRFWVWGRNRPNPVSPRALPAVSTPLHRPALQNDAPPHHVV